MQKDAMQLNIDKHIARRDERAARLAPVSAKEISILDKSRGTELWLQAQGVTDYIVPAFGISNNKGGEDLIVGTEEGAIYVTKEQVMAFFQLTEKPVAPGPVSSFHCIYDGNKLEELRLGFLKCSCGAHYLPTVNEEGEQSLTHLNAGLDVG